MKGKNRPRDAAAEAWFCLPTQSVRKTRRQGERKQIGFPEDYVIKKETIRPVTPSRSSKAEGGKRKVREEKERQTKGKGK